MRSLLRLQQGHTPPAPEAEGQGQGEGLPLSGPSVLANESEKRTVCLASGKIPQFAFLLLCISASLQLTQETNPGFPSTCLERGLTGRVRKMQWDLTLHSPFQGAPREAVLCQHRPVLDSAWLPRPLKEDGFVSAERASP